MFMALHILTVLAKITELKMHKLIKQNKLITYQNITCKIVCVHCLINHMRALSEISLSKAGPNINIYNKTSEHQNMKVKS